MNNVLARVVEVKMIIKFKLGELYDIFDDYMKAFDYADLVDAEEKEEEAMCFREYRVVIPQIHASFREGQWYAKAEDEETGEVDWELQDGIWAQYEENEKDINKYISYACCELDYFVKTLCEEKRIEVANVHELECFVDVSEYASVDELEKISKFFNEAETEKL